MTIQPDEIWVADIPFTDASGSKKRPVLVLWLDESDVIVSAVTTAAPRTATDIPLTDWKQSGLRRASTVRLSRLDCFEQSLLIGRIGLIAPADAESVKHAWATHIKLQF